MMASGRPCLGRPIATWFFPYAFLLTVSSSLSIYVVCVTFILDNMMFKLGCLFDV